MSTLDIKQTHEVAACRRFLSIYNLEQGSSFNFLRQGNPDNNEPDCICSDDSAIELVGAYDNQYQAEKLWSEARGKDAIKQPDYVLLTFDNLQNAIGRKLQKLNVGNYSGFSGKIILVCHLHSPLLITAEVERYTQGYIPFRQDGFFDKYFDEIWISWRSENSGNWKIKRIE